MRDCEAGRRGNGPREPASPRALEPAASGAGTRRVCMHVRVRLARSWISGQPGRGLRLLVVVMANIIINTTRPSRSNTNVRVARTCWLAVGLALNKPARGSVSRSGLDPSWYNGAFFLGVRPTSEIAHQTNL